MMHDDDDERTRRSRARRWLVRGGLALAIIPLVWLVAINVALWTGLVETLVSGERPRSTVRLEYGFAWCVWPTRVHVNDLHLQIDAARWQLELELPQGEVEIELHELLGRRLAMTKVRGHDTRLAFSFKQPFGTRPSGLEGFNRIEGFPAPILDEEPRPIPDEPWEVVLLDVDAELSELHVNAFEATMQGHLAGSLDTRVTERFGLPSLELDVAEGELYNQGALVAQALTAQVELSVRAYDPMEVQGREALRMLWAHVQIQAMIPSLAWLEDVAKKDLPVSLHDGEGTLVGEVTLDRGVLAPGSHLIYQAEHLGMVHAREHGGPLTLGSGIVVEVRAKAASEAGPATLVHAELTGVRVGVSGSAAPWMTAPQLSLHAGLGSLDLVEGPGELVSASLELPAFTVDDLGLVGRVGSKLALRGGDVVGHLSAHTQPDDPRVFALDFATDIDGLVVEVGDDIELRTDGYLRSKGTLTRDGGELALEPIHAKLQETSLRTERGSTNHDWLELSRATLRLDPESGRMTAQLDGRLADLRSVLAHLRPGEDVFQRVPELGMGTEPVSFSMKVTRTSAGMELDIERFEGKPVDVLATISRRGDATRAAVYFRRAHVGLSTTGGGSRNIDVAVGPKWFHEKQAWVRAALKHEVTASP